MRDRIGRGGYGGRCFYVHWVHSELRPVAVKTIYDILVDAARENRQMLERIIEEFCHECNLLKVAKHLNVMEFIGVFKQLMYV